MNFLFSAVEISSRLKTGNTSTANKCCLLAVSFTLVTVGWPNVLCAEVLSGPITNPDNGNRYYLLEAASWTDSQKEAVKLGGNLVTINDEAEETWVNKQFASFGGRTRNLWIGLNDAETEGAMVWCSGEPVKYTHWVPREPNDALGGEDYVVIWGGQRGFAYGGYWNDLPNTGGKYRVHGVVEVATVYPSPVDSKVEIHQLARSFQSTQATRSLEAQNFDSVPADWIRISGPLEGHEFGYSATNHLGKNSRGEAGGKFVLPTTPQFYVDTTIGDELSLSDSLQAYGDIDVIALDRDFNANVMVGFMDKDDLQGEVPDFVGLVVLHNSASDYRVAACIAGSNVDLLSSRLRLNANIDRKFTINWNPNGGKNGGGLLVTTVSGPGGGALRLDLTPTERSRLRNVKLDSFGLTIKRRGNLRPFEGAAHVYVDNLVYTSADHHRDLGNFVGTYFGAGDYRVTENSRLLKITKHGNLYVIDTGNWIGTGFWDRKNWQYEGVCRYKDQPTKPLPKHQPGGEDYNAVGYHRIKPLGNGKFSVLWTLGLDQKQEQGTYVIERVHMTGNAPKGELGQAIKDPTPQAEYAFVYLNNSESTASFRKLMSSNGLSVDLIGIDDVPTTDLTPYKAVIAGPDIERAWSKQAADAIKQSNKPVLGLGEGGSALFEKFHLDIGWMHTYHGGQVGLRVANLEKSTYWTSLEFDLKEAEEQLLYSSTGHVAVHLSNMSPGVIPLSHELNNNSYSPLIEQDGRYLLWGFRESPLKMTRLGKQLFVHTCRYVANGLGSRE